MKFLKALFAVAALFFSLNGFALEDDQYMEFTGALSDGNLKVVKKYIEADPKLVNEQFFAWKPLQMAATKGRLDVVKYLIEKGADKDYAHPASKMTAFHLAAFDNHVEVVKYLAAQGVDINKKMKGGISLIRVIRDEGNTGMVDLLTSLGVKDDGCQEECF